MSKIDSTRLPQVLAALAKPKDKVVSRAANNPAEIKPKKGVTDLEVLREHLQSRLQYLKKNTDTFHSAAPIITIQEILRWEFGERILEHPEFENISKKVAQTMLEDQESEKAIYAVIYGMVSLDT
ncbi:hypothetical protein [Pseudomonas cichorii]|uniref:hypothetical protein n=1 Tax=Pseudomonas cichorii TaxID=36746 RepID=UPI001C8A6A62|nr:hypothetical protein [Pseudomonas cichorii]MBX8495394.1 hypothetical protein [Pseudomonas cichorii]MBX8528746.1 hypothetical protein [Pseudomonas cichorii]